MFLEYLKIALRSISKRKKRTFLTMLGVFIGIAAVVALVSLGQGLQKTINDQFGKVGADKIFVQAKDPTQIGERVAGAMTSKEVDLIDKVHGVVETAGVIFRGANVQFNDLQRVVFLMGAPDDKSEFDLVMSFMTYEVEFGRGLTHKDKGKAAVAYNLANKNVFGRNIRVGDKIKIEGEVFDVVGTFKRTGDPGADRGVLISFNDAERLVDVSSFNYVVAQTNEDPDAVAERIEKALRRDRHLDSGKEDFVVQTSTDLIESFNSVFNIIQVVFAGIAAISLLVGGIGIANVMFTAVLERTREIGVMKAIGAKNSDVLWLFMIESGLLGLAGGVIGVLIGALISKGVEFGANSAFGPGTIYAFFPTWLIVGALLFSFGIGALSGVIPAMRASKLKPVEALRYE